MEDCADLLATAQKLNIKVVGVAFHVGSGATNPQAFADAIAAARLVCSFLMSCAVYCAFYVHFVSMYIVYLSTPYCGVQCSLPLSISFQFWSCSNDGDVSNSSQLNFLARAFSLVDLSVLIGITGSAVQGTQL